MKSPSVSSAAPPPSATAARPRHPTAEAPKAPFRERLRRGHARASDAPGEDSAPLGAPLGGAPLGGAPCLLPQPDGSFRVLAQPAPTGRARATNTPQSMLPSSVESLQVGRGARELRLHVRLGAGPHAGVEVRGVWEDGRVRVELLGAPHGPPPDLDAVRAVLRARGLDGVGVDLSQHGSQRDRRPPREPEGRPPAAGAGRPAGASPQGSAGPPEAPPGEAEW